MISFLRVVLYSIVSVVLLLVILSPVAFLIQGILMPLIWLYRLPLPFSIAEIPWFIVLTMGVGLVLYLAVDYLAGITYRLQLQGLRSGGTAFPYWKDHGEITGAFGLKGVDLYINDTALNAFALQSPSRRGIVLGQRLLDEFAAQASSPDEVWQAVRAVIGHESSHLKNGDYAPAWIYHASQTVLSAIQGAFLALVGGLGLLLGMIPFVGNGLAKVFQGLRFLITWLFVQIRDRILPGLLTILDAWSSRRIELRCDYQSAQVVGADANLVLQRFLIKMGGAAKTSLIDSHPEAAARVTHVYRLTVAPPPAYHRRPSLGTAIGVVCLVLFWFTFFWYSLEKIHVLPVQIMPGVDWLVLGLGSVLVTLGNQTVVLLAGPLSQLIVGLWNGISGVIFGWWTGFGGLYDAWFGTSAGLATGLLRFLVQSLGVGVAGAGILASLWWVGGLLTTYVFWELVKGWLKPRVNRTQPTGIDFLLDYSVMKQSRPTALRALLHGALVTVAPLGISAKMDQFFKGLV